MATWKKVLVSGSNANLAALQVDSLLNGVVTGSADGTLGIVALNGTGTVVATTGAANLSHSGSFSGSFTGNFSGSISGDTIITLASSASAVNITDTTTGTGPYYPVFVSATTGYQQARVDSSALTYNATTDVLTTTASFAITASYAERAAAAAVLTIGDGLSGSAYNGSTAVTVSVYGGNLISVGTTSVNVNTASLSTNQIPKFINNTLSGSNIADTGTQVQIGAGATSGLSVAAGGVNVTGNSIFNNNVIVSGDFTVNGTTTFINTDNLYVEDRFVLLASGSNALGDGGIIVQYDVSGNGSAMYLEGGSTGTYGRWAVAYGVTGTSTAVTADEFVVTAKINQASDPSAAPVWGSTGNGSGNLWITTGGDIFIYA